MNGQYTKLHKFHVKANLFSRMQCPSAICLFNLFALLPPMGGKNCL